MDADDLKWINQCIADNKGATSDAIVRKFTANDWLARAAQITRIAATTMARQNHVIVCGYGRSGQNLARFLEHEKIPVIALDVDPERIREAAAAGEHEIGRAHV